MRNPSAVAVLGALVGVSACAGLDKPGLETYGEIRAAIVVKTDPAKGIVTASSEAAAKESVTISDIGRSMDESGLFGAPVNSQRRRKTVFVQADRQPDGTTQVYIVYRRNFPISEVSLQDRPWTETDPDRTGLVGQGWREVPWELVEFRYECPGSQLNCTRYATDRLKLSTEDVRALLRENSEKISVSLGKSRRLDWSIDGDELTAVVDVLDVREQFR